MMIAKNGQNLTVALGPCGRELYGLHGTAEPRILVLVTDRAVVNRDFVVAVLSVVIFGGVSIVRSLNCT